MTKKYWDYDTAALMRELNKIMQEYSPSECFNESESFCAAYGYMKYAEGKRLKGEEGNYFCPWSAGDMSPKEFCEKYTPIFKNAEQIIIDLYYGKALVPETSGPGNEVDWKEDLDEKEKSDKVDQADQAELQEEAVLGQGGPGVS